jgi:MYXO-CTERM domain-containing protein
MDTTTVAVGVAFLVALALYLMRRRGRSDQD